MGKKQKQTAEQPQPVAAQDSSPTNEEPVNAHEEMARRIKFGGRKPGSVNRVTGMTKTVIVNLLTDYQDSGLMGSDFLQLEPKDRIVISEKMMQYIMPKMQSTAVDFNSDTKKITIEQRLKDLSKLPEKK